MNDVLTKSRPILFSGPMVRAILDGRKTETRRVLKPQPPATNWNPKEHSESVGDWIGYTDDRRLRNDVGPRDGICHWRCPYGVPDDHLWVRETWASVPAYGYHHDTTIPHQVSPSGLMWAIYRASWERCEPSWRPSIFMPRWASRLTVEVTDVRVERLSEISDDDVKAEGFESRAEFLEAWDEMYAKKPGLLVSDDPWVWVIGFERVAA